MSGASEQLRKIVHRVRCGATLLAVAGMFLAGCGDATRGSGAPSADPRSAPEAATAAAASEICVSGRATAEGIECQAFRADDGRLYTLLGDLDSLAGDRDLCVCGRPVEMSTCMQGTTITVGRIGPPDSCP